MRNKIFSLFDLQGSYPLSESERSRILRYVDKFAMTSYGAWLNSTNYRGITLKWCPGMTTENGVIGCFAIATNTIYLQPENVYDAPHGSCWVELMAPILIHELRHVYQWRKNRLGYIICSLPLLRQFTLERDAEKVTAYAQTFCDNVMSAGDSFRFEQERRRNGN